MNEGEKKTHKPGLGTSKDATDRHAISKRAATKKKREQKLTEKRRRDPGTNEDNDLISLIAQLPQTLQCLQDVEALDRVLKFGERAEPYFAPSNVNPAQTGPPWIFPEQVDKVERLVSIVSHAQDIPLLRAATNCLLNIVSHDDSEWTHRCFPALPGCFSLLKHCPDTTVRENVVWMMANMCLDRGSSRARDVILGNGIIPILLDTIKQEDWIMLQVTTYLFKSFFLHHPLPPLDVVGPIWQRLVSRLEEAPAPMVHDLYGAVKLMLRNRNDAYKLAVVQDTIFWPHVSRLDNMDSIRIVATLSHSRDTTAALVERGVIDLYVRLLNHPNPEARAEGGLGLSNLAEASEQYGPLLCQPQVLNAVQSQLRNTDVFRVRKQVYWFICSLITNASTDAIYPLLMERGCVRYISDVLHLPGENDLKVKALRALKRLYKWDQCVINEKLEELGADDKLHDLTTDGDLEIQQLAMQLVESQEDRLDLTQSGMFNF